MGMYSDVYIKCHNNKLPEVEQWLQECGLRNHFKLHNIETEYPTYVAELIKWYGNYSDRPDRDVFAFRDWVGEQQQVLLFEVDEYGDYESYGDENVPLSYERYVKVLY